MKVIPFLLVFSFSMTGVASAQNKLMPLPNDVDTHFYEAYLKNPGHDYFGGVIRQAAASSDPVQFLNDYTKDYNDYMEKELKARGYAFQFANAATGLEKALFYADIWHTYSTSSRSFGSIPKVDLKELPPVMVHIPIEMRNTIKKFAGSKLDAAFAEADASMKLNEYNVSDRAFRLPLAQQPKKAYDYRDVKVESSYEVKDGQPVVTLNVSKDIKPNDLDSQEDGILTGYGQFNGRLFAANVQAPQGATGKPELDKWDFSKVKINDDGQSFHFENKIQYTLKKNTPEANRFMVLVAPGAFELSGKGRGDEWEVHDSTLTLRIPGVTAIYDPTKPFTVVRSSDREVLTGASPKEMKDADYKNSPYIGVPATAAGYKQMIDKLTELKKAKKLSMISVDGLVHDLHLEVLPRRACES